MVHNITDYNKTNHSFNWQNINARDMCKNVTYVVKTD